MKVQGLFSRLPGAYARRVARWFGRRPYTLRNTNAIITFTFDDFPRSALLNAGKPLEDLGSGGTYFASHGLVGHTTATGEIFCADDLPYLLTHGHELGCHTFHHCPAWETMPPQYELSVDENASALSAAALSTTFQTHSYPISYPRPATKRRLGRRFRACRGGGQTFNLGTVDLNYLKSFFLEQSCHDFTAIEQIIGSNAEAGGWLIFSTHDVCDNPTRFGCTPSFFEQVVKSAFRSGARIVTMSDALDAVGAHHLDVANTRKS